MKIYIVFYEDSYGYTSIKGLYDTFHEAVDNVVENNGLDIHEVYEFEAGDTEESVKEQLRREIREYLYSDGKTNFVCGNYSVRGYEKDKWLASDEWSTGCDSHNPDGTAAVQSDDFDMDEYMSKKF